MRSPLQIWTRQRKTYKSVYKPSHLSFYFLTSYCFIFWTRRLWSSMSSSKKLLGLSRLVWSMLWMQRRRILWVFVLYLTKMLIWLFLFFSKAEIANWIASEGRQYYRILRWHAPLSHRINFTGVWKGLDYWLVEKIMYFVGIKITTYQQVIGVTCRVLLIRLEHNRKINISERWC